MRAVLACVLVACTTPSAPSRPPPPPPSTPREHAVATLRILVTLDKLDRATIASVVEARHVATEGGAYRTEHHFTATPLFARVEMIEGVDWQLVSLAVAPEVGLALADLDPIVLDAPYATSTRHVSYATGDHDFVMVHHFRLARYELVVSSPPRGGARGGTVRDAIEGAVRDGIAEANGTQPSGGLEITLTTEHHVPPDAPTLRAFRAWVRRTP